MTGLKVARERGRIGGPPRTLDEEDISHIQFLDAKQQGLNRADLQAAWDFEGDPLPLRGARQGVGAVGGPANSSLASQKRGVNE
jgi:hypothetical protein